MKKTLVLSLAAFVLSSFMMVGAAFASTPSGPVSVNATQTHHKKWHKKHMRRHHKRWHKKWHKKRG